jgi:hypothetical protein
MEAGRHPHIDFRDLLKLHSRYGPLNCSTAQGGLCHEAPAQPVTQPNRSSATGANRQLSGWLLPPLVTRALGAHSIIIRSAKCGPPNVRVGAISGLMHCSKNVGVRRRPVWRSACLSSAAGAAVRSPRPQPPVLANGSDAAGMSDPANRPILPADIDLPTSERSAGRRLRLPRRPSASARSQPAVQSALDRAA